MGRTGVGVGDLAGRLRRDGDAAFDVFQHVRLSRASASERPRYDEGGEMETDGEGRSTGNVIVADEPTKGESEQRDVWVSSAAGKRSTSDETKRDEATHGSMMYPSQSAALCVK